MSLIGDLPGVGLTRLDLSLSMWMSMKRFSQDSLCDVNVNCAINVLKFRLGRFQKIITRMSKSICATSPRNVQMIIGIVMSHCLSYWRRFWKGIDRLTRDRSVLRCSRMTIGIWLELIGAHNLSTRIGIGMTLHISHLAIGLILESEVTVIVDQYQCVKAYVSISEV